MSIFGDILGIVDSGRAADSVSNADIAAEHGVLGAVKGGQDAISNQIGTNTAGLGAAGQYATGQVNDATGRANAGLDSTLQSVQTNTAPYTDAGAQGAKGLQDYAASKPTFSFDPQQYFNSPAYQFQLQSGTDAIQNRASAMGLASSGNTLKDLTTFGQGLGATYYNDAFNRAKSTFDTNQSTTLQNLSALINTGEFGTSQVNNATTAIGGQKATNTVNAGTYAGNTNLSIADLLAGEGMQGTEFGANLGLTGSKLAGDYAVGAGQAHAGGIMNQGAAIASLGSDVAGLFTGLGKP